jgi:Fe-S-cluster-containing hydrogenase component 2
LGAITLNEETDEIEVDPDKCFGCGICTLTCSQGSLKLHRYERSTTFETSQKLLETVACENRE